MCFVFSFVGFVCGCVCIKTNVVIKKKLFFFTFLFEFLFLVVMRRRAYLCIWFASLWVSDCLWTSCSSFSIAIVSLYLFHELVSVCVCVCMYGVGQGQYKKWDTKAITLVVAIAKQKERQSVRECVSEWEILKKIVAAVCCAFYPIAFQFSLTCVVIIAAFIITSICNLTVFCWMLLLLFMLLV